MELQELPQLSQIISLQDVIRCGLCETPVPPKHCYFCKIHLCETCVGTHLSEDFKEHIIVPFKKRDSPPKCSIHSTQICTQYCKGCKIPFCTFCVYLGQHTHHETMNLQASEKINVYRCEIPNKGTCFVLLFIFLGGYVISLVWYFFFGKR